MNDENILANSRKVDDEAIKFLTNGFISIYHPTLVTLKAQLIEAVKKQEFLCDELHTENLRLSEAVYSQELLNMFSKIKIYKDKLNVVKKEMMAIHELSTKLKKRALKLEQQKQKEALEKVQKREYEELLISKPSTS